VNGAQLAKLLSSFKGAVPEVWPGSSLTTFSVNEELFGLIDDSKQPIRLSLRCDPKLASVLRDRYDEVLPGQKLDPTKWNTILLTGQLSRDEIKDLIRLSYNLALGA